MKRVLVLSFSPIARDPRVMRQLQALQGRHAVSVAGFGPPPAGGFDFHEIGGARPSLAARLWKGTLLLARRHEAVYWRLPAVRRSLAVLRGRRFDLVVANDVSALPLALLLASGAPVLLDAHEFTPAEFEDRLAWRLFFGRYYRDLCRRYLPQTAGMTTVCEGIATAYRSFGVSPKVVLNCPEQQALPVRPVAGGRIRLVHHGVTVRSRRLEWMLQMMGHLDQRFTLDLMLVDSDPVYLARLRTLAAGDARIRFRDPVPMQQIASTINEYDIGVFLLPPVNFNYRMALPNKFFEFVQARLAVAIGPSPEMARLVQQYGFGIVTDSFDPLELARRLNALQPADIERMKQAADVASRELNATAAARVFLGEVDRLLG